MDTTGFDALRVFLLSTLFAVSRVNCQCTITSSISSSETICLALDVYQDSTFTTKYSDIANIDERGILYIGLRTDGADRISLVDCWLTPTSNGHTNFRFGITTDGCRRQPHHEIKDNDSNFVKLSGDFLTFLPEFIEDVTATCDVIKNCPVFTGCKPACSSNPTFRITSKGIHKQPEITLGGGNITSTTTTPAQTGNVRTVFIVDYQVILIVVVCILVLLLIAVIFILVWRQIRKTRRERENNRPNLLPVLKYETTMNTYENGNTNREMEENEDRPVNTMTDTYTQIDRSKKKSNLQTQQEIKPIEQIP